MFCCTGSDRGRGGRRLAIRYARAVTSPVAIARITTRIRLAAATQHAAAARVTVTRTQSHAVARLRHIVRSSGTCATRQCVRCRRSVTQYADDDGNNNNNGGWWWCAAAQPRGCTAAALK